MSVKNKDHSNLFFRSLRSGAAALLISLFLLLPGAMLIRMGMIPEKEMMLLASGAVFFGSIIAALVFRLGKEGGIGEALLSSLVTVFLLLILSATIPHGRILFFRLIPVAAALLAGTALGSIMQINKKYRKHHRKH